MNIYICILLADLIIVFILKVSLNYFVYSKPIELRVIIDDYVTLKDHGYIVSSFHWLTNTLFIKDLNKRYEDIAISNIGNEVDILVRYSFKGLLYLYPNYYLYYIYT